MRGEQPCVDLTEDAIDRRRLAKLGQLRGAQHAPHRDVRQDHVLARQQLIDALLLALDRHGDEVGEVGPPGAAVAVEDLAHLLGPAGLFLCSVGAVAVDGARHQRAVVVSHFFDALENAFDHLARGLAAVATGVQRHTHFDVDEARPTQEVDALDLEQALGHLRQRPDRSRRVVLARLSAAAVPRSVSSTALRALLGRVAAIRATTPGLIAALASTPAATLLLGVLRLIGWRRLFADVALYRIGRSGAGAGGSARSVGARRGCSATRRRRIGSWGTRCRGLGRDGRSARRGRFRAPLRPHTPGLRRVLAHPRILALPGRFGKGTRRIPTVPESAGRSCLNARSMTEIHDSILSTVGTTPMVRLSRIGRDLPCELLGKCDFLNPGGSVKDRIGVRMILDAEKAGRIKPGDTLIEPTSGNTGIGMALAAAVRGYRMIITMPEKMSREKQVVLEALGAEIIRTPTEAAWDSPDSHIGVANRLREVVPNSHILDQYSNPSNPTAHEEGTGEEIWQQCGGKLDAVVLTAGTGGTITGVARALKRHDPNIKVIGVDPAGSLLAGPEEIKPYKVEGIGYDFIPDVLDRELVDQWVKSHDGESFRTARQLIRQEGLLVGGSSGAAAWAALQIGRAMPKGSRVVTLLPDSVRNYLTKFVDDRWMRENGFLEPEWAVETVADMLRSMPSQTIYTVEMGQTLAEAVTLLKGKGISQLPVLDSGKLAGILTEADVLHAMVEGQGERELGHRRGDGAQGRDGVAARRRARSSGDLRARRNRAGRRRRSPGRRHLDQARPDRVPDQGRRRQVEAAEELRRSATSAPWRRAAGSAETACSRAATSRGPCPSCPAARTCCPGRSRTGRARAATRPRLLLADQDLEVIHRLGAATEKRRPERQRHGLAEARTPSACRRVRARRRRSGRPASTTWPSHCRGRQTASAGKRCPAGTAHPPPWRAAPLSPRTRPPSHP